IVALSQLELELISERTSNALQWKKQHNEDYTHARYGMRFTGKGKVGKLMAGKKLVAVPEEQAVIEKCRRMRAKGLTYRKIAGFLNEKGVRTKGLRRQGQIVRGKWYASTVRNILL